MDEGDEKIIMMRSARGTASRTARGAARVGARRNHSTPFTYSLRIFYVYFTYILRIDYCLKRTPYTAILPFVEK
jgi:hypothetical protein